MVGPQVSSSWIQEKIKFIKSEVVSDSVVDDWFLISSVWPIQGIISAYLLFVLKLGPKIMEKRKPLEMKRILIVYNLFQIYQNGRIFWLLLEPMTYAMTHMCSGPLRKNNNPFFFPAYDALWYFVLSKVTDLLDTVFFVLRKKQSQVTFLHVFHHAIMVFNTWVQIKYLKGEHGAFAGLLNSFVHVVMYLYYFLAALGPSVQKYLWWKKYITALQMVQFVLITAFPLASLWYQCEVPLTYSLYLSANTFFFLLLFFKFYSRTYGREIGNTPAETKKKNS